PPRDLQYRPGQPVHQRRFHRDTEAARGDDQYGRQGPLHGQHLRRAAVAQSQIRGGLPQCLCDSGRSQGRHWLLAGILQRGTPAPEPGLSHAAANLPGGPVDMWTIGVADRLSFARFRASSESGEMLAFAHIPTGTAANNGFDIDEVNSRLVEPAVVPTTIGAGIET